MPYAAIGSTRRVKIPLAACAPCAPETRHPFSVEQKASTYIGLPHARFEITGWPIRFELTSSDLTPRIGKSVIYDDPFQAIVAHS